ncbi:MAG: LemA family protein [Candidatus Colwellbacteria bacterium]|nr:LemA family protein [Candidatus Colwellbacteria bacterium]
MSIPLILIIIAIVVVFYVVSIYNWFQTALVRIKDSIQEIGNQLKRQANLIPNLEEAVKGYLKHEKDIFKLLTDARKAVQAASEGKNLAKIDKAESALNALLPKLQILVESNPEIKAEKVITRLMEELSDTADKLMYARRVVIDLSADFNQRLVTFPTNIIGNMFGFKQQAGLATPTEGAHLEVSQDETKDQKVKF